MTTPRSPAASSAPSPFFGVNALVAGTVFASRRMERLVDGDPILVARDGQLLRDRLRREVVTYNEVVAAARHAGIEHLAHVRLAILERRDKVSVFPVNPLNRRDAATG